MSPAASPGGAVPALQVHTGRVMVLISLQVMPQVASKPPTITNIPGLPKFSKFPGFSKPQQHHGARDAAGRAGAGERAAQGERGSRIQKKSCKNFAENDNCFYESCQGSVGKGLKMRQNKRGKGTAQRIN